MQVGIVQQSGIPSLKKQKSSNHNLGYKNQLANSDTVSFKGQAEIIAAKKIINKHAIISGGLGFTLSQVIGVDSAALLANNYLMTRSIAKDVYKSNIDKGVMKKFIAGASVSTAGVKAAAGVLTFIPIVGNIVNTAISFGITKTMGSQFIKLCEKGIPAEINATPVKEQGRKIWKPFAVF
jgi:hypothetical protein